MFPVGLIGWFTRKSQREGEGRRIQVYSPFMEKRINDAMNALSRVIVPGYDVDIVSSGVVTKIRVSFDGSRIVVYLDYTGSNPGCSFCRFLNDRIWKKILDDARTQLEKVGFRESIFLDSVTGSPIVTT